MARPLKKELEYFPLDCEFDSQFKALEAVHGNDGTAWMIHFWQWAYRNEKGHVDTNGAKGVFLGENSRITQGKQSEIIKTAVELNLLYEAEPGIYTSNGIQKRISLINEMREKWRIKKEKEFSKGKIPGKLGENPRKTPQRESKRESKSETITDYLPPDEPDGTKPLREPRQMDEYFDFVKDHWQISTVTRQGSSKVGGFASRFMAECVSIGKRTDEILRREKNYLKMFPNITSTPSGLLKWWGESNTPDGKPAPKTTNRILDKDDLTIIKSKGEF